MQFIEEYRIKAENFNRAHNIKNDFIKTLKDIKYYLRLKCSSVTKTVYMKSYDLDSVIEKLEKQIQYLHNDYKALINRHNTINDLRELRIQIKQAEESLRLNKKIRFLSHD